MKEIPNWAINEHTIICGYRGSIAHGTYVPNTDPDSIDDIDLMSIVVPPINNYFGLKEWGSKGTREVFIDEWDLVEYEIRKYVNLLLKCNPNVLALLWLDKEFYLKVSPEGQKLIDNRNIFVSMQATFDSFYGYCTAQLQQAGRIGGRGFRGQKRKELVERYGYDTKNAAHCIRLIRMGKHFIKTGELQINRKGIDDEEILAIKKGAWSFDRFVINANNEIAEMKAVSVKSVLPEIPDYEKAEELCIEIIRDVLKT